MRLPSIVCEAAIADISAVIVVWNAVTRGRLTHQQVNRRRRQPSIAS
ncbi:hypothetical protein RBSWK_00595 [Rhodopirellula baltica SWK14]|uniref:Uncharacterized protein n=1 Tax=Rhodopirellula baltica SWK14 TaxID=993516 RepID=L7CPC2_RHOBT|nr:hypothetical protein RBSWK_00595 [Rhodopirellula baltica SWK14]